jgi:hypothetical protein
MDKNAHCNFPFLSDILMPLNVANPSALNAQFLSDGLFFTTKGLANYLLKVKNTVL